MEGEQRDCGRGSGREEEGGKMNGGREDEGGGTGPHRYSSSHVLMSFSLCELIVVPLFHVLVAILSSGIVVRCLGFVLWFHGGLVVHCRWYRGCGRGIVS